MTGYPEACIFPCMAATVKTCPLTPRQLAILEVVSMGGGKDRAAEVLGGSPATVHTQLARIRAKLRVNTTTAAVAQAIREGWIT